MSYTTEGRSPLPSVRLTRTSHLQRVADCIPAGDIRALALSRTERPIDESNAKKFCRDWICSSRQHSRAANLRSRN